MRLLPMLAALLVLSSSCAAPVVSPTTTASASASPSSANLMEVTLPRLDVEAGPEGLSDMVVTPATLNEGDAVWIVETDDRTGEVWHLVAGNPTLDEIGTPFGWIPDAVNGGRTLRPRTLDCPTPPLSVPELVALGAFGGLACYGGNPIDLIGFTPLGCGAGGSPRTGTPDWLNGTWSGIGIGDQEPVAPDFEVDAAIAARTAPGADVRAGCGQPGWFRFRGHFDDPASATCRTETAVRLAIVTIEPRLSELLCRTSFVITDALPVEGPPRRSP